MPDDSTIQLYEALPTLNRSDLGQADRPIDDFLRSRHRDTMLMWLAAKLVTEPQHTLERILPYLSSLADEPIEVELLPVRFRNRVGLLRWRTWGAMLPMTIGQLLQTPGIGRSSVERFIRLALERSLEAASHPPPPRTEQDVQEEPAEKALVQGKPATTRRIAVSDDFTRDLRCLLQWRWATKSEATLGETLGWAIPNGCPTEVASAVERINALTVSKVLPGREPFDLQAALKRLCEPLESRELEILDRRLAIPVKETLEQVGEHHGITRERVRQLENRTLSSLREAIDTNFHRPLRWAVHHLRQALGLGWPAESHLGIVQTVREIMNCSTLSDSETNLLLFLAGPYQSSAGWIAADNLPSTASMKHLIRSAGRTDPAAVHAELLKVSLHQRWHERWIETFLPLRRVKESHIVWPGNLMDGLVQVLDVLDEPATVEEILEACGEEASVRSTRSRMQQDARFIRVDKHRIGLAEWGMAAYSGVTSCIAAEIERCGGDADAEHIVKAVVDRFDARPSTVRFYLDAPMFVHDKSRVRLRQDEPFPVPDEPPRGEGYELQGNTLRWPIQVDTDYARGSGRPLAVGVAGWLGLQPGGEMLLRAGDDEVSISWPMTSTQPALGSIRPLLKAHGFSLGDQVIVCINRDDMLLRLAARPPEDRLF